VLKCIVLLLNAFRTAISTFVKYLIRTTAVHTLTTDSVGWKKTNNLLFRKIIRF